MSVSVYTITMKGEPSLLPLFLFPQSHWTGGGALPHFSSHCFCFQNLYGGGNDILPPPIVSVSIISLEWAPFSPPLPLFLFLWLYNWCVWKNCVKIFVKFIFSLLQLIYQKGGGFKAQTAWNYRPHRTYLSFILPAFTQFQYFLCFWDLRA